LFNIFQKRNTVKLIRNVIHIYEFYVGSASLLAIRSLTDLELILWKCLKITII